MSTDATPAAPLARILVVDDEHEIADLVALYLQNAGFEPHACYDGAQAWELAQREDFDLAIIDVMLPGMNGVELCERIRRDHLYPIIMLTAKVEEDDRIRGLTAGADDYVTKPFLPLELVARVKAQLRRSRQYNHVDEPSDRFEVGGLVLDLRARTCTMNERPVMLTPTEFDVLRVLCEHRGEAVAAPEIYRQVWGEEVPAGGSGAIAVHIRHLREKLGDSFEKPKYIKTVWGCGYKID